MNTISVRANAKINLTLAVKFRRNDGYHEIESILQEIDYYDILNIEKAESFRFTSDAPDLPTNEENICVRAAKQVLQKYRLPAVRIDLEKNIPIGAGLGGGSSDAVAVIKGILRLFGLDQANPELYRIAVGLGSDVPFFLNGKTAYVSGWGEILKSIQMPGKYCVLLVLPDIEISTAWAYKNLKLGLTKKSPDYKLIGFEYKDLDAADFHSEFYNDFEKPVFAAYPILKEIRENLYQSGADFASLSGSGSALYGIFRSKKIAETALIELNTFYRCLLVNPVL